MFFASISTCYFGVNYAIKQKRLTGYEGDTDWLGIEWLERGGLVFIFALLLVLVATTLLVLSRRKKIRNL